MPTIVPQTLNINVVDPTVKANHNNKRYHISNQNSCLFILLGPHFVLGLKILAGHINDAAQTLGEIFLTFGCIASQIIELPCLHYRYVWILDCETKLLKHIHLFMDNQTILTNMKYLFIFISLSNPTKQNKGILASFYSFSFCICFSFPEKIQDVITT